MQRPLFAYERFMLAGGHPYTVMIAARLHGAIDQDALRDAIDWLQSRYPALACAIEVRHDRPHFVTRAAAPPIPLRIEARLTDTDWQRAMARELDQPLPRDTGPLARLVWLRGEAVSELVLVTEHVICDGRSAFILLGDLIARLPSNGSERPANPGFTTIDELCGPAPWPTRVALRAVSTAAPPALWLHNRRSRKRWPAASDRTPSYVFQWSLDRDATAALDAAAKRERVNTYAVLATAFLRAILQLRPHTSQNRLVSLVDPRPFFAIKGNNLLFPTPPNVPLSLDRGLDDAFWAQARHLGRALLNGYLKLRPDRMARLFEHLHPLVDRATDAALRGPRTNDLAFSHLTNVDFPQGPHRAETLAQLGSLPWSESTAIMSLAANGRLSFSFISRESVLPRADAERIRDLAMARITQACTEPAEVPAPA